MKITSVRYTPMYTLMHKNVPVSDIETDEASGAVTKILSVENAEHLPVGVHCKKGVIDRRELSEWWGCRSVPECRPGMREALDKLNVRSSKTLLTRCLGLSLSDSYWIRPKNTDLKWESVNFYDNVFSEDMGDLMFGVYEKSGEFDLHSPDITTDGCLKKRWRIIGGKRFLLKGGEPPYYRQPFNEAAASIVMDRLGIPHIPYSVTWQDGQPYSLCEDFAAPRAELVSAWQVLQTVKKANHENYYVHYTNLCRERGIADITHYLDMMIVLDYIIANEDRHFNNFGIMRDPDTLEWTGAAPIFDNGTSLAYGRQPNTPFEIGGCKPFKSTHIEELKLVKSFDWIDFSSLKGIEEEISEITGEPRAKAVLGEFGHRDISRLIKRRINELEKFAFRQ